MRTSVRKRQLATCLSLCCILYAFAGRGVHAGARLGFKLVRNYLIVIPVRVNGQGPFEFLLDTGTNSTLITPQLAGRLGLRPTDHIPLITLSGTEIVPRAALDSLALGATSTKHLEVIFDDLSGIRLVDSKIHGVLGQNFLSRFNYLIDYRERYVEFEEDGELGRRFTGATLALELDEGKA